MRTPINILARNIFSTFCRYENIHSSSRLTYGFNDHFFRKLDGRRFVIEENLDPRVLKRHYGTSKPSELSYESLVECIEKNVVRLIDVRPEKEVSCTGLIGNAKNIPLETLKEALSKDSQTFEEMYQTTKPDKSDDSIVFYAKGPVKSSAAVELARKLGYKKARHYPGGWKEWSENAKLSES